MAKKWFFKEVRTTEELKNLYRQLAMQYHPDKGGDTATMQEINAQYQQRLEELKWDEADDNWQKGSNFAYQDYRQAEPDPAEAEEAFKKANEYALTSNPFFEVARLEKTGEIVAYGRTFDHKDFLKSLGFWWEPERGIWVFHRKRKPFNPRDYEYTKL